jgi:hypothetical protein
MGWLLPGLEVFSISGVRETRKRKRMLRRRVPNVVGHRWSMGERQRLIGECLFLAGLKIAPGEKGWIQGQFNRSLMYEGRLRFLSENMHSILDFQNLKMYRKAMKFLCSWIRVRGFHAQPAD